MKQKPPAVPLDPPPVITFDAERMTQREAARLLRVSFPTCSRYMTTGRHGVRLPSAKIGGKRFTTREALAWFFEAAQVAEAQATQRINRRHTDDDDDDFDREAEAELEAIAAREGL